MQAFELTRIDDRNEMIAKHVVHAILRIEEGHWPPLVNYLLWRRSCLFDFGKRGENTRGELERISSDGKALKILGGCHYWHLHHRPGHCVG